MDFTILCPNCNTKLKLFDSQVKKKTGYIRCVRCGARIKYDLTKPQPAATGFWPDREVPFKPGAQRRFLSIAKAMQEKPGQQFPQAAPSAETGAPRVPPAFDRSEGGFAKFDLKTGQVLPEGKGSASPTPAPRVLTPRPPAAPDLTPAAKPPVPAKAVPSHLETVVPAGQSPAAPRKSRNIAKTGRAVGHTPLRAALHPHPGILQKAPESFMGRIRHFFLHLFHGS